MQYKHAAEICRVLGFADKIHDIIQNLIYRKQHLEAVRFICTFELMDKFAAVILLKEYLENSRSYAREICRSEKNSLEAQDKAIDTEVATLKAILECIVTFKLQCEFLPENHIDQMNIKKCSVQMEKGKVDRRHCMLGNPQWFKRNRKLRRLVPILLSPRINCNNSSSVTRNLRRQMHCLLDSKIRLPTAQYGPCVMEAECSMIWLETILASQMDSLILLIKPYCYQSKAMAYASNMYIL
ncbi:Frigida domain-containing protein [Cephalotus follicularis]|uniref:FRIGIDA-like protein n=1 Tax=Cephalotus follicularis TaxID=3775 RepID=A0A1Q3D147_CEPFO|nr:Frigida domain-containing protein [Cephalotus follicularis]